SSPSSAGRLLLAASDDATADGVVVLLAEPPAIGAERAEAHAVGMPRQALVVHEQELHRLIEGDLVLACQANAPAAADALHGGFGAVGVDAFGLRALERCEDRGVRGMAPRG